MDVSQAYEAIKGSEYLPNLDHVTVKSSVYGVRSDKISSPLTISDSSIRDNQFAGIQIKGRSKAITIQNTVVDNTTKGDGLSYSEIVPDPVDFCSVDVNAITFPISFQALGKARTNVECTKVTRYVVFIRKQRYRDKKKPFSKPGGVTSVTGNILTPPLRESSPSQIVVHCLSGSANNNLSVTISGA